MNLKEERVDSRTMHKADFVTSVVLIAFSISALVLSLRLPRLEHRNINPWTVPGMVPGFLAAIILVLGILLLVRSIRHKGYRLGLSGAGLVGFLRSETFFRLALTVGLGVVYAIFLVGAVPYWIATFVYIVAFILIFELRPKQGRRPARILILAVVEGAVATAAVASVFQFVFLIDLP